MALHTSYCCSSFLQLQPDEVNILFAAPANSLRLIEDVLLINLQQIVLIYAPPRFCPPN